MRQFTAARSNQLWVVDFTFAATWDRFAYVALAVDMFASRNVGRRAARSMRTDLGSTRLAETIMDCSQPRSPQLSGYR